MGTLFSGTGQWIQQMSVGWLTYELTGSAFLLGAISGARTLPALLLGPFGGLAADRLNRKLVMLACQVFLMTVTAVFATLVLTGNARVWNIFLFTVLTGVAWIFNVPARQATVPGLVPPTHLTNAIALNSSGFNLTRIIGPSIGGVLIAVVGLAGNFYLQALTYVGVVLMIVNMRFSAAPASPSTLSAWRQLADGIAYVWNHPTLRPQMAMAIIPVMLVFPYISLLPIFAKDVLRTGPTEFGLLSAAPGFGALLGTLTIATVGNVERKGRWLFLLLTGAGVSLVLFSLSRSFPLSAGLLMLVGMFHMTYMTTHHTLLHTTVPNEYRGRAMGITLLNQGLVPLGSLIAGALAEIFTAPLTVMAMGAGVLALTGLAFALFQSLREV